MSTIDSKGQHEGRGFCGTLHADIFCLGVDQYSLKGQTSFDHVSLSPLLVGNMTYQIFSVDFQPLIIPCIMGPFDQPPRGGLLAPHLLQPPTACSGFFAPCISLALSALFKTSLKKDCFLLLPLAVLFPSTLLPCFSAVLLTNEFASCNSFDCSSPCLHCILSPHPFPCSCSHFALLSHVSSHVAGSTFQRVSTLYTSAHLMGASLLHWLISGHLPRNWQHSLNPKCLQASSRSSLQVHNPLKPSRNPPERADRKLAAGKKTPWGEASKWVLFNFGLPSETPKKPQKKQEEARVSPTLRIPPWRRCLFSTVHGMACQARGGCGAFCRATPSSRTAEGFAKPVPQSCPFLLPPVFWGGRLPPKVEDREERRRALIPSSPLEDLGVANPFHMSGCLFWRWYPSCWYPILAVQPTKSHRVSH